MVAASRLSLPLRLPDDARVLRVALGADPGVQFGLALAALVEVAGVLQVRPLELCLLGQRAVRSPKALARPAIAPTYPEIVAELRRMLAVADALGDFDPALVCEDWFIGPNGSTVRDTAQMFYFAQAAAQELGLRFRPVMHATWKAATLGSARLSSDDAARAYGSAATALVGEGAPERWAPPSGRAPTEADDAAALCVARWYLGTEVAQ